MMDSITVQTRSLAALAAVLIVVIVLELVRRRRLQERYIVTWIVMSASLLAVCGFPGLLGIITRLLGARAEQAGLLALIVGLLAVFALHTTIVISRLSEQVTRLAQELAVERAMSETPDPTLDAIAEQQAAADAQRD